MASSCVYSRALGNQFRLDRSNINFRCRDLIGTLHAAQEFRIIADQAASANVR